MPPVWKPQDPEILKHWVKELMENPSEELTDWEERFVKDMWYRLELKNPLTQYQEEKLEEIYAEKTS